MASNSFTAGKGLKSTFRALNNRNYRLFFGGQSISLIGTWMQQLAVSWLVYRLTHSTFLLGIVGFASFIPAFILTPFVGVLVDRWNRHRILVITQILSLIQATILAILVLTNMIVIWQLIVLSATLGFINAIDSPTRQAFINDLVDKKDDLSNAVALSASMYNAAVLVGPSIAGILIALFGEGVCFLLNALSFIPVIIALLAIRITPKERKTQRTPLWQGMKEGFTYAFRFQPIRYILLLLAWGNLIGVFYTVLLPVVARDILSSGAHTFGFLTAASACGALAGTVYLAARKSILGLEKVLVKMALLFAAGLILFSISQVFWISMVILLLTGFGNTSQFAVSSTFLQTIVEEDKRGRIMSLFVMAGAGMRPFGHLLAGALARIIGTPNTIMLSGGLCLLSAIMFAIKLPSLMTMINPIYVKKGIIEEEETEGTENVYER